MKAKLLVCILTLVLLPISAQAVLIDFEGVPATANFGESEVFNDVTFSVVGPSFDPQVRVFRSESAYILSCDFGKSGNACEKALDVDFGKEVTNLDFDYLAVDNDSGVIGTVTAFFNNAQIGVVDLVSQGRGVMANIDLSGLGSIDRLLIDPTDPAGLGYDNFDFDVAAVPVPAGIWLFASALIGFARLAKRS